MRHRLEFIGWLLFLFSSFGFVIESALSRSWWALGGSVLFLFGVVMFLLPATRPAPATDPVPGGDPLLHAALLEASMDTTATTLRSGVTTSAHPVDVDDVSTPVHWGRAGTDPRDAGNDETDRDRADPGP